MVDISGATSSSQWSMEGGTMVETARATDAPSVVFACGWCGRPVTLVPSPTGAEIQDLSAFLREHAECLRRAANAAKTLEDESGLR